MGNNKSFLDYIGYNQKYFWTGFWLVIGIIVLSLPIFYANLAKKIYLAPSFLWALGYLMAGIVIGFIFGVPTIISKGPPVNIQQDPKQICIDDAKAKEIVRANTNLTQISDWLTKLIIGAGLVELSKIPDIIKNISKKMAKGIMIPGELNSEAYAAVFSGGIILLFLCYGFIFGYLIMRIILTELFKNQNDQ